MKKVVLKQSLIIALLALCGFAYSQDVFLKYTFVKGKSYVASTKLDNIVTQTMGGREIKMENRIGSNSELLVEDVNAGGDATVLLTLKNSSIYTKIEAMGKDTTMIFNDLNDQSRMVLSALGKQISSVDINPESSQRMYAVKKLIKLQGLPGKSLKIGEIWTEKLIDSTKASAQSPVNMIMSTDMEYTLVGKDVKDGVELVKVAFSGAMIITGNGNMQGMDLFVEGTGKTEGVSYFSPKTSIIVSNETNTEMDMSIAVSGQQNMTMPMTQSMKSITIVEEKK